MDDLIEDETDGAGGNAPEFTVSELSGAVKRTIEGGFSHVRVRGEIGRVSRPRSGHVYLDLKDDRAVLAGVIWKGQAARLRTPPEEGLEVVATGRLTTFPGQSKYQIVIESLAPAGVGALMAMLERRKQALAAEGLFDAARKRPLPYLPEVIGVVTSPSGAVIRDILHRLRDRFPRRVLIWPVAVQGERSAAEVARAIAGFNALAPGGALPRPNLLIVARGGGSLEDLWGFNEEAVVRAAAGSAIPLIAAVGHETDTTLIDLAADRRAPTPTAAAEMAVPVRAELIAWSQAQAARLAGAMERGGAARRQRLRDLTRALPRPQVLTEGPAQRLDHLSERLPRALTGIAQRRRSALAEAAGVLRPSALSSLVRARRDRLQDRGERLEPAVRRIVARAGEQLTARIARLSGRHLSASHGAARQRLGVAEAGLVATMRDSLAQRGARLDALDRLRLSLGYRATLARGYAVLRQNGQVVTDAAALIAAPVEAELRDGRAVLGDAGGSAARKSKLARKAPAQPGLFDEA